MKTEDDTFKALRKPSLDEMATLWHDSTERRAAMSKYSIFSDEFRAIKTNFVNQYGWNFSDYMFGIVESHRL